MHGPAKRPLLMHLQIQASRDTKDGKIGKFVDGATKAALLALSPDVSRELLNVREDSKRAQAHVPWTSREVHPHDDKALQDL